MKMTKIPFSWGKLVGKVEDVVIKHRKNKFEARFLPWATKWANAVGSPECRKHHLSIVMGYNKVPCINMLTRRVIVGYSELDLRKPYNAWEHEVHANLGHEMGHENYTSQEVTDEIRETIAADFQKEFPSVPDTKVSKMICQQMAAMLCNMVEDGRIETQFARQYPLFQKLFRNSNLALWKLNKEVPKEDYDKWQGLVIDLSVLGAPPLWMRKLPKGDPLRKLMTELSPILDQSCEIPVHEDAKDFFYQVYEVSKEYLKEALKDAMENSPKKQDLIDKMKNFQMDFNGTSGSGGGKGSSGGGSSGGATPGGGSPRISSSGKPAKEDKDGEKAAGGGGSEDDNGSGGAGKDEGTKPPDKTSTYMGDNVKSEGSEGGVERASDEELAIDWDALEDIAREAELDDETLDTETTAQKEDYSISDELAEQYENAGDSYANTFKEIPRTGLWSPQPLPEDISAKAKTVAKAIENIRANRAHSNPKDKGRINNRKLYRYAVKDYNIFKDKKVTKGGLAGAIAWDGSGSMSGPKQIYSGEACALVERAFNDIPLKIINFSVAMECEHYIVKDFDEKSKNLSYSYGYAKWRGFNGGNKDGYSIRVLTRQLLERSEEKKFLFILSDGLPSDYSGGFRQGRQDVHDAVAEAIDAGISVIAIAFGSKYDREENHSDYEYMYTKAGAKLIECDPKDIQKYLTKIMTEFALKNK